VGTDRERAPATDAGKDGNKFAFDLTHDANVFLPLLVGSVIAHAFTVLTLRRSILTEKVARSVYPLSREYAVDPLEILFVREVMRTNVVVLPAASTRGEIQHSLRADRRQRQRLLGEIARANAVEAHTDEPLRVVVHRMGEKGLTRIPVVERATGKFLGLVCLNDLLKARTKHLEQERRRDQPLKLRFLLSGGRVSGEMKTPSAP
jgi:chloride channel protein, CIC family